MIGFVTRTVSVNADSYARFEEELKKHSGHAEWYDPSFSDFVNEMLVDHMYDYFKNFPNVDFGGL